MIKQSRKTKQEPGFWQRFGAPMLLASLGLHGLLLFLPVASSEDGAIPPPDFEQDNIAITRIPPTAPPQNRVEAASGAAPASTPAAVIGQRSGQVAAAQPGAPTGPSAGGQQTAASQSAGRNRASASANPNRASRNPQSRQPTASNQTTVPELPAGSNAATPAPPPPPNSVALQPRTFSPEIHQRLLAHAQTLSLPQAQLTQLAQVLVQQYGYSADNTSGEAYNANLSRWVESIKQGSGNSSLQNEPLEPSLTVTHYRRVCLAPPPQPAVVGAVVSPQGNLQGEPTLLKSTGYAFLDRVATQAVKQHDFSPAADQKAYTVNVSIAVDYGKMECLKPYPRPAS